MPRVSFGLERNHMSMWPVCFWVDVGTSVLSGRLQAQAQRPALDIYEWKKSRNCHHSRTLCVCSAPGSRILTVEPAAEGLQDFQLKSQTSVTLQRPLRKLGSFAHWHMGTKGSEAYAVSPYWLPEWLIIPESKLTVGILSPSLLLL